MTRDATRDATRSVTRGVTGGPMNLQRRVSSALVALVAVFVAAQGVLAYLSLEEQEDRMADELVLAEARELETYAERGDLDGPRAADILERGGDLAAWLVRGDGAIVPRPLPDALRDLPEGLRRVTIDGRFSHVLATDTPAGRLVIAYDAQRNEEQVRQYGLYLLGLGALCIGLAFAAARQLARIVVGPMQRLTVRLADWVPGDGADEAGRSDEETRLLAAFGRVQARYEQAIAREREFSANVGHELRTPLAALRSDLEMLEGAAQLPAAQHVRVARMLSAVDAIAASIEAAASMSRTGPVRAEPVDLGRVVDDAWLTLEPTAQQRGLSLDNRIAAGTVVRADRHALLTIVRNLLRNAAEHAAPARCTVDADAGALRIEDDGPGIPAELLPRIFERAWRGPRADTATPEDPDRPERGLGLAIARRLAELNGWSLAAEAATPRGVRFVLRFAPER